MVNPNKLVAIIFTLVVNSMCTGGSSYDSLDDLIKKNPEKPVDMAGNSFSPVPYSSNFYLKITEDVGPNFELVILGGGQYSIFSDSYKTKNGIVFRLSPCTCSLYSTSSRIFKTNSNQENQVIIGDASDSDLQEEDSLISCLPAPRFELMAYGVLRGDKGLRFTNIAHILVRPDSFDEVGGLRFRVTETNDWTYIPSTRLIHSLQEDGTVALTGFGEGASSTTLYSVRMYVPYSVASTSFSLTSDSATNSNLIFRYAEGPKQDVTSLNEATSSVEGTATIVDLIYAIAGNFSATISSQTGNIRTIVDGEIFVPKIPACEATLEQIDGGLFSGEFIP